MTVKGPVALKVTISFKSLEILHEEERLNEALLSSDV